MSNWRARLILLNNTTLGNALAFNGFWALACVGQDAALPFTVAALAILILATQNVVKTCLLAARIATIGILVDVVFTRSEIFVFPEHAFVPLWLALLWLGFSTTLVRSLKFLNRHLLLAALFGAIGGPSSYFAGYRFGAVEFGYPLATTLLVLAVTWACLLPLFFTLARQLHDEDLA
ncbi:MAG: DUF2878 domain-containing protein [Halieaceae bacterium]|nr:DUF2878 domain-containing protein [Halieaceae bacterium]